jgi:type II secretory pathway pseudopilin PulG
MQRKNNFLTPLKSRGGFAMITAIIVVMIIGTLMAFSLALVSDTSKRTTDLYLYEQTVLYSKSAAELALLDIAQNGCQNTFNTNFNGIYDANVTMQYVYTGAVAGCNTYFNINTPEQNGSVLMDITVTTNEGSEPIRYFRRVMQKL